MKKIIICLVFIFSCLNCSIVFSEPSEAEIKKAFNLTFKVFVDCTIKGAFGKFPEGASGKGMNMNFNNVSLPPLKIKNTGTYKLLSGKITVKNKNDIYAELILAGGVIKNIKWVVKNYEMQKKSHTADINADGKQLIYTIK